MNRFYSVMYRLFKPLLLLLFPVRVQGRELLPQGAALICPNHSHALDPVVVCLALGNQVPIRMMAKKQLLMIPLVGGFLRMMGAFAVNRGASDIHAVKESIRYLQEGQQVMLFPEGTRVKEPGSVRAKSGVALIAAKAGAPLVPVYCSRGRKFLHRTDIIFGEPYVPQPIEGCSPSEQKQAVADEVLRRAYALGEAL